MTFNNIINHLKLWCSKKAELYHKANGSYGGIAYTACLIANELDFKLSTLTDRSFESTVAFKTEVLGFLDVHYEPSLLNPQNRSVMQMIDKTNQEFLSVFDELLSRTETIPAADVPYNRVIVGPEAEALQKKFCSVWGYVNASYWFPLMGDAPKDVSDKFFIMFDYFEPYMKQFEQIAGLPESHLYRYGESNFRPPHCIETVELMEYCGLETIYTDKDFSWAIYFSHENTVAFAGSIVPKVKELLSREKEHWDRFEWDW